MKTILTIHILAAVLAFSGCMKTETVDVADTKFDNTRNEQRLTALESALALNFNNDSLLAARVSAAEDVQVLQNERIANLEQDLAILNERYQAADAEQRAAIEAEKEARLAKDADLQRQIDELKLYTDNSLLNLNIDLSNFINGQLSLINSSIASNAARILALEDINVTVRSLIEQLQLTSVTQTQLTSLQSTLASIYATKDMLSVVDGNLTGLTTQVSTLSGSLTSLSGIVSGLSASQISLLKAPCSNSNQVILKAGSNYYTEVNTLLGVAFSALSQLGINTNYTTTDGAGCTFKITPAGTLVKVGN